MIPPDMQAMLGGGGAPAGPAGIPPELAALMGGGEAPPEEAAGPSVVDGQPGGGVDALTMAIDAIQDAIDAEADQEDIQVMLKCQQQLQSILAKNQKEADGMMQGKMSPRGTRQAAAAAGGGEY